MDSLRIKKLTIDNIKAIGHGSLSFNVNEGGESSNILAVYGANGTGKSSLIYALLLLKSLMITDFAGMVLGNIAHDFSSSMIREGKDKATINILLELIAENRKYYINYFVDIMFEEGKVMISNEVLKLESGDDCKYSFKTGKRPSMYLVKNIVEECLPQNIDKKAAAKSLYETRCNSQMSHSLFFYLKNEYQEDLKKTFPGSMIHIFVGWFNHVKFFTDYDWKCLRTGSFPNSYIMKVDESRNLVIPLVPIKSELGIIDNDMDINELWDKLNRTIDKCNTFLNCIGDDFQLKLKRKYEDGKVKVYLLSKGIGNDDTLFVKESYGRFKILHLLSSFVNFIQDPFCCIIIDEFDEGLFEFLFGELITLLKEYGVGQLVFTAHNLISAERLENVELYFTTNDVDNRFKRIPDVKNENNIRKIYFKEIQGLREGSVFKMAVDKDRISNAFTEDMGMNVF